jgi:hypothetical protein
MTPYDPRDDDALLEAVARTWAQADPPPEDLADGVLARLAAEGVDLDVELELLTLVESELTGTRSAATTERAAEQADRDEVGSWSMEYVGPDLRVYVRLTRSEDGSRRLDGWVVPARPLQVRLRVEGRSIPQRAEVDEHGRFEFPDAPGGLCRLTFVDEPRTTARPRVTPPFWI